MTTTINHRERFKAKKDLAKQWSDLSVSEAFVEASSCAMLHMASTQTPPNEMGMAAANAFRMEGARFFLSTLMQLTDVQEAPKRDLRANLNHNV